MIDGIRSYERLLQRRDSQSSYLFFHSPDLPFEFKLSNSPALLLPVVPTPSLGVVPERNAVVEMGPGALHPLIASSSSPSSSSSSSSSASSGGEGGTEGGVEGGVVMTTRLNHTKAEATVVACEDPW